MRALVAPFPIFCARCVVVLGVDCNCDQSKPRTRVVDSDSLSTWRHRSKRLEPVRVTKRRQLSSRVWRSSRSQCERLPASGSWLTVQTKEMLKTDHACSLAADHSGGTATIQSYCRDHLGRAATMRMLHLSVAFQESALAANVGPQTSPSLCFLAGQMSIRANPVIVRTPTVAAPYA